MTEVKNSGFDLNELVAKRSDELFVQQQQEIFRRTDNLFKWLMLLQWLVGIGLALLISPRTWSGQYDEPHIHVIMAVFLGGLVASVPVFLVYVYPTQALTRHVMAVAQMLFSALYIHLTGGRIETHFHIFGSLAFLAFYRDWWVLLTASVVVTIHHLFGGIYWPVSTYGLSNPESWRWLEHAVWVVFEDAFLFISIQQSMREMKSISTRQATLQTINAQIEKTVLERTAELSTEVAAHRETESALKRSKQALETLIKASPVAITAVDFKGRVREWNPEAEKLFGWSHSEIVGKPSPLFMELGQNAVLSRYQSGKLFKKIISKSDSTDGNKVEPKFQAKEDLLGATVEKVPSAVELACHNKEGSVVHVCLWMEIVRDTKNQVAGAICIFADISEKKKAEQKLAELQKELLITSRQAGMAEVATGVLHNIGNVLNSVNVSANLIFENIKKSKVVNLGKVANLLEEHKDDLAGFITTNPKGTQLAPYLQQLSGRLEQEQETMRSEADLLRKNIEHIKDIVTMQQSYAQVFGVTESVCIVDLVEDAIKLNAGALVRHDVEVIRKYDAKPTITIDRHKVLQILVNLIRNAKYACDESGKLDKKLTLNVTNGGNAVKITIADNGVGIPQENLTRIFNHGFTTRKEGHGFGLHSGALSAKELGGELLVHSEGVGQGASFTLELPLEPPDSARN